MQKIWQGGWQWLVWGKDTAFSRGLATMDQTKLISGVLLLGFFDVSYGERNWPVAGLKGFFFEVNRGLTNRGQKMNSLRWNRCCRISWYPNCRCPLLLGIPIQAVWHQALSEWPDDLQPLAYDSKLKQTIQAPAGVTWPVRDAWRPAHHQGRCLIASYKSVITHSVQVTILESSG